MSHQDPQDSLEANPSGEVFGWLPRLPSQAGATRAHAGAPGERPTGSLLPCTGSTWKPAERSGRSARSDLGRLGTARPSLVVQLTAPRLATHLGLGIEVPLAHCDRRPPARVRPSAGREPSSAHPGRVGRLDLSGLARPRIVRRRSCAAADGACRRRLCLATRPATCRSIESGPTVRSGGLELARHNPLAGARRRHRGGGPPLARRVLGRALAGLTSRPAAQALREPILGLPVLGKAW